MIDTRIDQENYTDTTANTRMKNEREKICENKWKIANNNDITSRFLHQSHTQYTLTDNNHDEKTCIAWITQNVWIKMKVQTTNKNDTENNIKKIKNTVSVPASIQCSTKSVNVRKESQRLFSTKHKLMKERSKNLTLTENTISNNLFCMKNEQVV